MAVTYDETTNNFRLYVNGNLVSSGSWTGTYTPASTPMYIGRNSWGSWEVESEVDELRVFDYALTEENVRSVMQY